LTYLDGSAARGNWRRGRFSAWLCLVVGLVLLTAGVGQSVSAFEIFLAISQTMSAGDPAGTPMKNPAADDMKIREAPRWAEAQDLFLLAWAKNRLVASREPSQAAEALLASATSDTERAVESAPGFSPGWLMLADLRREAGAPESEVAKLLKISILTAPFDPYRVHGRLVIGFSVYSSLDEEGRDLLATQIQMAWRHSPTDLVKLALVPDRVDRLFLTRLALAAEPPVLSDFEGLLARLR
jgi:hypothetical protein